jgi:protein-disulfide isomerase
VKTAQIVLIAVLGSLCAWTQEKDVHPMHHATAEHAPEIDRTKMADYLRHLELWPPQVTVTVGEPKPSPVPGLDEFNVHLTAGEAAKDVTYYISRDGRYLVRGDVHNLHENPFAHDLALLKTAGLPSFGPANAPVTLIIFSDFECPLCKQEAKVLRTEVPKQFPNEVRVVFHDFPLVAIHPWAKPAAVAGRCIFDENPPAFWQYFDFVYDHQSEITSPADLKRRTMAWAKAQNLDTFGLGHCLNTAGSDAEQEVDREVAEGKKLEVDATPTMFLDGRRLVGDIPWQSLSQIIQMEIDYQKQHSAAGRP